MQKFTLSVWVKRSKLGAEQQYLVCWSSSIIYKQAKIQFDQTVVIILEQ